MIYNAKIILMKDSYTYESNTIKIGEGIEKYPACTFVKLKYYKKMICLLNPLEENEAPHSLLEYVKNK